MNKKFKFNYEENLPIICGIIFVICIIFAFTSTSRNIYDTSVLGICVTVSGSCFLTSIVYYLKNNQAGKVANIKADMYKVASRERLHYNKEMILFMEEHNVSREQLDEIEADSPDDEIEMESLNSLTSSVDTFLDEATNPIEKEEVD